MRIRRPLVSCELIEACFAAIGEYEAHEGKTREFLQSMRGTTEIAYVAGMKICMIPGDPMNFKITHPADLQRFRMIVGE